MGRIYLESKIKKYILSYGADICGIANMDRFSDAPEGFSPADIFEACKSVITFGLALPRGLTKVESRLIYGYFNGDVCHEIDKIALKGAKLIESEFGGIAVPIPCDGHMNTGMKRTWKVEG